MKAKPPCRDDVWAKIADVDLPKSTLIAGLLDVAVERGLLAAGVRRCLEIMGEQNRRRAEGGERGAADHNERVRLGYRPQL